MEETEICSNIPLIPHFLFFCSFSPFIFLQGVLCLRFLGTRMGKLTTPAHALRAPQVPESGTRTPPPPPPLQLPPCQALESYPPPPPHTPLMSLSSMQAPTECCSSVLSTPSKKANVIIPLTVPAARMWHCSDLLCVFHLMLKARAHFYYTVCEHIH